MERRHELFINDDGSIEVEAYVGNGHGVHTNKFPVKYEEMIDIPNDILFRTNQCIISAAYCRLLDKKDDLQKDGVSIDEVVERIQKGFLRKKRDNLCHSDLFTKDAVETFLKYVKHSDIRIGVFSFDKLFEFEKKKTFDAITTEEESQLYQDILQLERIEDGTILLSRLGLLQEGNFRKYALLLLKCKVYDIEDQHYLKTKKHDEKEKEQLKIYQKSLFSQM